MASSMFGQASLPVLEDPGSLGTAGIEGPRQLDRRFRDAGQRMKDSMLKVLFLKRFSLVMHGSGFARRSWPCSRASLADTLDSPLEPSDS